MKKIWKIALLITTGIFMLASVVGASWILYKCGETWVPDEYEMGCYVIHCVCFTVFFYLCLRILNNLRAKITTALTFSLLCTLLVLLTDNLLEYICVNNNFGWEDPISYIAVLRIKFSYDYNYDLLRYPQVFVTMLFICGLLIFWTHPKTQKMVDNVCEKLEDWIYKRELKKQNISDIYYDIVEKTSVKKLIDFVQVMPLNEQNKLTFMNLIDEQKDTMLILLLFVRFENLLTEDEYTKYKKLYIELTEAYIEEQRQYYATAEVERIEVFERLDEKFNIAD